MPIAPDGRELLVQELDLRADCARCTALCCVALTLTRSADFAIDKPAGVPCPNLGADFLCGIHERLPQAGFPGCTAYDCLGAGQQVTAAVAAAHGGATWRDDAAAASAAFAALPVATGLRELLWYLTEVLSNAAAGTVHDEARAALADTSRLTTLPPGELAQLDVGAHRRRVGPVIDRASALVRAAAPGRAGRGAPRRGGHTASPGPARRSLPSPSLRRRLRPGSDLVGERLATLDLTGTDLRGALLIGADLRGADLTAVDLLGADLRGVDARGADLSHALFLTPAQAGALRIDATTRLPSVLDHRRAR